VSGTSIGPVHSALELEEDSEWHNFNGQKPLAHETLQLGSDLLSFHLTASSGQ
jgi:hypothetical protein